MNDIDLNGRQAIVTGAAQGLGRAIAERLQASGASVHVWDLDPAAMAAAQADWPAGGPAGWTQVDVADPDAVDAALRETLESAGGIDILVNNAGISGPTVPTWEYAVDDWRRVIDIDLTGPFLVSRAVVPSMRAAGWGRIVNIASVAGKEGNPQRARLQRREGGPDRPHQEPRQGARRLRRAGQLRDAGGGGDPHLRPDDADPHRHDEGEDPARALRPAAGDRRPGGLALLRGLLVLDRRRVRSLRRPRDLLIARLDLTGFTAAPHTRRTLAQASIQP